MLAKRLLQADACGDFSKWVEHTLSCTRRPPLQVLAALLFVRRATTQQNFALVCHVWSAKRLWAAAFLLADGTLEDESYRPKDWVKVLGWHFRLEELLPMQLALCELLDWELRIDIDGRPLEAFVRKFCAEIAPRGRRLTFAEIWRGPLPQSPGKDR
jgi:hypothetical protein